MLVEIATGFVAFLALIYFYLTWNYDYWKKKGVIFVEPRFPLGLLQDQAFGKTDAGTTTRQLYVQYKRQGLKYFGAFMLKQPTLMVVDLDLCKQILTKDFSHFVTRNLVPVTHEYITKHLFNLDGQEWRHMRIKLTPTFTSGKMKGMFLLMEKCAKQLQEHIDNSVLSKGEFEVKDLIARFTMDIIATCAFGLEVNSITDGENEFYKIAKLIFMPKPSNFVKFFLLNEFPIVGSVFKINFIDPRVSVFLKKVIEDTVAYRKLNNVSRHDFVDLLLEVKGNKSFDFENIELKDTDTKGSPRDKSPLKSSGEHQMDHQEDHLTLEDMTAQAFLFFAAGFETAASTTSFCLYELAKNPEVQEKLRQEIDEVLSNHGGEISYQALQEMTYMDQVMNETLRMYASLPFLTRVCTETYQVPGTDLVIDKGVRVNIPTYAIHHDPDIYPDPLKFDPDRFSEENVKSRHPYAFLPFGEGPRICIGMRFGKLQVKLGLAAILSRYELSPAPDTPSSLEISPFILITTAKHPFRLRLARRSDLS